MNKSNFDDKNKSNNNAFLVLPVLQTNNKLSEGESHLVEEVSKNNELCTLCEDFASEALNYLSENKTQTEIISILHKSCSKIPTIKQQVFVEHGLK